MKMHKVLLALGLLPLGMYSGVSAETATTAPFSAQYITPTSNANSYDVHLANGGIDTMTVDVSVNGTVDASIQKLMDRNILNITGLFRSNAELIFTKNTSTPDVNVVGKMINTKEVSNAIKIRRENTTRLKPEVTRLDANPKNLTMVWFESPIADTILFSSSSVKQYAVNINGTDYPLIQDTGGNYADGKYYINNRYIEFVSSNLSKPVNTIRLKIDGVYSNYVNVKKELYELSKPDSFQFKDVGSTPSISWVFNMPRNAESGQTFEFYLNGNKLDNKLVSVYYNQFTINYPLSSMNGLVNVYIRNPLTGDISNTISIKTDDYVGLSISKLGLWDGKLTNAEFSLEWGETGFLGNASNWVVNINGQDYTRDGVKNALKDEKGKNKTDQDGNILYETKYQIKATRTGRGITFNFYYNNLKDGENIIYFKNTLTNRTSNKMSFTKGNYTTINYAYGDTTKNQITGTEGVNFENVAELVEKKIDFLYSPVVDIPAAKIGFTNLIGTEYYKAGFKIASNLKVNPFKDLSFNGVTLSPKTESDGTVSYYYEVSGLGSSLSTGNNLIFTLNEYFNIPGNSIKLGVKDFIIRKMKKDSSLETVYASTSEHRINIAYLYEFGNCFDGNKDYCAIKKLTSPYLVVNLGYDAAINVPSKVPTIVTIPAKTPVPTPIKTVVTPTKTPPATVITNTGNKKNVSILTIVFKSKTNIEYNQKLKNLYATLKTKKVEAKAAINEILKAMKVVEDGGDSKKVTAAKIQILRSKKILGTITKVP